MANISRRSFIYGASLIPFSIWFAEHAQGQTPLVRYDARSPQGITMLEKYAAAVNKMKNSTREGSPVSWVFQWYTHRVNGDKTKQMELNRIYPTAGGPDRMLADEMWSTCQNHDQIQGRGNYFLPWHRMYVYFFERIVRKACGDQNFTLPYWNYLAPGVTHAVVPEQFRKQGDVRFGPLFVPNRNPNINTGERIDQQAINQGAPQNILNPLSLAECQYHFISRTKPGFCSLLDNQLHGYVHGMTGDGRNMGSVEWAANDPIFWAHHCNIDRMWASWNRAGRKNFDDPTFLNEPFIFADENGNKVVARVRDFMDTGPLNYTYDAFEAVPNCPPPPSSPASSLAFASLREASEKVRATVQTGAVALGTAPVRVLLDNLPEKSTEAPLVFSNVITRLRRASRVYLVVAKLRAEISPGIVYNLFLEPSGGPASTQGQKYYAGTIHFFDAVVANIGEEHSPSHTAPTVSDKVFTFDITSVSRKMQGEGLLGIRPVLTVAPVGTPPEEAKPVIGEISVIEE